MRLAVGVLTYERPLLLRLTLETLWRHMEVRRDVATLMIVDNGSSEQVLIQNTDMAKTISARLHTRGAPLPPASCPEEREQRISEGFATLARALLETDCSHAVLLEDDWECIVPPPLQALTHLLDEHPCLGQIRLRDCQYDSSLEGCSARNFVTKAPIRFECNHHINGCYVSEAEMHWTNNPSLVRRDMLHLLVQNFASELEVMHAFWRVYTRNGQLRPGSFLHRGPTRRRPDFEAMGMFNPAAEMSGSQ